MTDGILVEDLRVMRGRKVVLDAVGLAVRPGETVAVVGESGAGKTTLVRALLGDLDGGAQLTAGAIHIAGVRVDRLRPRARSSLRLGQIGYIPQDPGSALNPLAKIDTQLRERLLLAPTGQPIGIRAVALLRRAGIADPERILPLYPHQTSGGYRQRILIALALAGNPGVLLADEATSALDPITQREVLDQLGAFAVQRGSATLLVTHDMAVATERADRVVVLRDGRVVDDVALANAEPQRLAPYTRELIAAVPILGPDGFSARAVTERPELGEAALSLRRVTRMFANGTIGLDDVSVQVAPGRTTGLVGRSGSGKSTFARIALGLDTPTRGEVSWAGTEVTSLRAAERRRRRRDIQYVAQDPWDSLSPRMSVEQIIAEPLVAQGGVDTRLRRARVAQLLELVALPPDCRHRRARELSGGQRQRVAIARALATEPRVVVLDEPTAALDTISQARVFDLLDDLQAQLSVSFLLISHDIRAVLRASHDLVVLEGGRAVEIGPVSQLIRSPRSQTARQLLATLPQGTPLGAVDQQPVGARLR